MNNVGIVTLNIYSMGQGLLLDSYIYKELFPRIIKILI